MKKKTPKKTKKSAPPASADTISRTTSTGGSVTSTVLTTRGKKASPFASLQNYFKQLGSKGKKAIEEEDDDSYNEIDDESADVNTQVLRKLPNTLNVSFDSAKRFNFLVAGPSGAGKSTFCNSLLQRYFPGFEVQHKEGPTRMIEEMGRCEKLEGNTRIIITVIDTPGFGDSMHTEDCFDPIEKYIVEQNAIYEANEVIRHPNQQDGDTRIHCCFFFLGPHRVTPIDHEFMKRMQTKVPIVPVVAKADTMTIRERMTHLRQIHDCIIEKSIQVFDFKEDGLDASWLEEHATFNRIGMEFEEGVHPIELFPQIPNVFAVISGHRRYMWGMAREDDPRHSDTQRLHRLLFHEGALGRLYHRSAEIHETWRSVTKKQKKTHQKYMIRNALIAVFVTTLLISTAVYSFASRTAILVEEEVATTEDEEL